MIMYCGSSFSSPMSWNVYGTLDMAKLTLKQPMINFFYHITLFTLVHRVSWWLCARVWWLVNEHGVHGHDVRTSETLHIAKDLWQATVLTHLWIKLKISASNIKKLGTRLTKLHLIITSLKVDQGYITLGHTNLMFCFTSTATRYFAILIHKYKFVGVVQYCACAMRSLFSIYIAHT